MVNEDTVIKIIRNEEKIEDWPRMSFLMLTCWRDILAAGFPGIGFPSVTLVRFDKIKPGDIFIAAIDSNYEEETAPKMWEMIDPSTLKIVGIGCGHSSKKLGDYYTPQGNIHTYYTLRVDCRPTENGGPGYHYFYRTDKDFRVNKNE